MTETLSGLTRAGHVAFRNPKAGVPHSPVRMQNKIHFDVVGPDQDGNIVTKQQVRNVENIMLTYGLASAAKMLSTHTASGSTWAKTMAIGTSNTAAASTQAGLQASTQLCGTFTPSEQGSMTARRERFTDSGDRDLRQQRGDGVCDLPQRAHGDAERESRRE